MTQSTEGALIALAGVLVGSLIQALIAARDRSSAEGIMERKIEAERVQQVGLRAATACAEAVRAVQWLHPLRIEDSVVGLYVAHIRPHYLLEISRLQEAAFKLLEVCAQLPQGPLRDISSRCARTMEGLHDSWDRGRAAAEHRHEGGQWDAEWYDALASVNAHRASLTGWKDMAIKEESDARLDGDLAALQNEISTTLNPAAARAGRRRKRTVRTPR